MTASRLVQSALSVDHALAARSASATAGDAQGHALVDQAGDAPRGGDVHEDGPTLRAQLGEARAD